MYNILRSWCNKVSTTGIPPDGKGSSPVTPHHSCEILTIGYGGKNPAKFGVELGKLMPCCVVDVRRNPHHAFLNAFTKKGLEKTINMWNDCSYIWIPELGNKLKTLPPILINEELGMTKLRNLINEGNLKRVVLLCAEKDEKRCHRLYVKMAFLYGELREKIAKCWSKETSYFGAKSDGSRGQCYVTALLVKELLGGDILMGNVPNREPPETHYWNRLPDGTELDLTSDQYDGDGFNPIIKQGMKTRRLNLNNKRYKILKRTYLWNFGWK